MYAKLTSSVVLGMMCFLLSSRGERRIEAAEPHSSDVFISGIGGCHTYRIPSLICTPKGTLLAFCEGRKFSGEDQTPTDLVLKRSLDGGKTWGPMQVLVRAAAEAAMDPTAVIDRATGAVILVYDRWPELALNHWPPDDRDYQQRVPGLGRDSVTTWVATSSDDGATWSTPRDITIMTKKAEWTQTIHGPGVGIQTHSGRLVIPCANLKGDNAWWNYAIYSDDCGKTWRLSDNEVGPGVDESQIVELADGTLLLNMRGGPHKGCRFGATSKDGGKTWSEMFGIPELPDPCCEGSILRYTWADQHGKSRILFCNPGTAQGRHTGTVRLSYDETKTWPVAKVIVKDAFAYSSLTAMPDGTIGCLFEGQGNKIAFLSLSLDWLSDGKDAWKH